VLLFQAHRLAHFQIEGKVRFKGMSGEMSGQRRSRDPCKSSSEKSIDAVRVDAHVECLRWKNTIAFLCMSAPIAMYFGGSPLVFYMNDRAKNEWLAPGVTQPALMNIIANGLILNLAGNFVQRLSARGIVLMSLACLVNPALIAVSTYPGFETLQYLGAVVGAASFATALQFRPAVMQWWALDGRAAHGAAFIGFGLGLQFVAFTLIMAWLLPSLGLANAMYCVAGIFAALETYPIWLAIRGELGSPGILPTRTSDIESAETVKGGGTEPFPRSCGLPRYFGRCGSTGQHPHLLDSV
jgi:hypothetical protein